MFNKKDALFHLHELKHHLDDVIKQAESDRYDDDGDLSYSVDLGHLLDHLVLAWHCSRMNREETGNMSQKVFERLTYAIPRFYCTDDYRLVDFYEDP